MASSEAWWTAQQLGLVEGAPYSIPWLLDVSKQVETLLVEQEMSRLA